MENGLASCKVSFGYCISGQGLVQMQSGKSTIWKSCLPAAFYSSLIFGLTQDTGRTKGQTWVVRGFLHKDISRQQRGSELDKNETAAPAELGSIWSKPGMATAASWLLGCLSNPDPFPDPRHTLEAMPREVFTSEPQRALGTDELFRLKAKVEDSSQTTMLLLVAACHMSSNLGGASCVLVLILKTLKSSYFTHFESEWIVGGLVQDGWVEARALISFHESTEITTSC